MNKKEQFKTFAKNRPELVTHIKDGSMTWQKFYELYDIYGNDESVWNQYGANKVNGNENKNISLNDITSGLKNVNMNSVQKHIGTAQKAINLFKEFSGKGTSSATNALSNLSSGPSLPRPLNNFFED